MTARYRPPESASLYGFAVGFALRASVSVSATLQAPLWGLLGVDFTPQRAYTPKSTPTKARLSLYVIGLHWTTKTIKPSVLEGHMYLDWTSLDAAGMACGGEIGIRTLDTLASMPPFQGGAFGHSAISPRWVDFIESNIGAPSVSGSLGVYVLFEIHSRSKIDRNTLCKVAAQR